MVYHRCHASCCCHIPTSALCCCHVLLLLQVEFLDPPAGAKIGERVTVEGFSGEPDEVMNPKKKIFETVQPDLLTNAEGLACYKGVPLMTSAGPVRAPTVGPGATIR